LPDALIHTQGLRPARAPKIVRECSLPLTALRRVDLVVTELAVIEPTDDGLVLKELALGVGRHRVVAATGANCASPPSCRRCRSERIVTDRRSSRRRPPPREVAA
jgi:acyl CoA:acetate/3-ketoacid CoA transferase beta subunit